MAKTIHVKAKAPWKRIAIPKNVFDENIFDGLVDLQELKNYEFIRTDLPKKARNRKRKAPKQPDTTVSKKTKIEKIEVQTDDNAILKKKKGRSRKKKNQTDINGNLNKGADRVEIEAESDVHGKEIVKGEEKEKNNQNETGKKKKKNSRKKKSKTSTCDMVQDNGNAVVDLSGNDNVSDSLTKKKKRKKDVKKKNASKKSDVSITKKGSVAEENTPDNSSIDMSKWNNLFVPDVLLRSLRDQRFQNPTTVQVLTLPSAIRDHKDILAAAETGSGKTLAFGIPVLAKILSYQAQCKEEQSKSEGLEEDSDNVQDETDDEKEDDEQVDEPLKTSNPPMALILEPTRELAVQVHRHLSKLAKHTNIKFAIVVGGMSVEKQRRLLKHCPEVIIATPGRLWQLIQEGDNHLSQVDLIHSLVVDEADRMVEKGHYEELTKLLLMINKSPRRDEKRQSLVMSATLTMEISIPKRVMNKIKEKDIDKDKLKNLTSKICVGTKPKVVDLTPKDKVAQSLTEMRVNCTAKEKDFYLYYFLNQHPGRTLVFANSKDCLRRLVSVFTLLECTPYPLHADMQQRQRLKNLDRFSANSRGLLLASDVAARGLDIPNVDYVIHYQVPQTMENYVHRSGRTARASNVGLSMMLVAPEDAKNYRKIVHGVKNGEELPLLPVDLDLLPAVKSRVELARTIDVEEHRSKKIKLHNDFFSKAAEEMDMILDDETLIPEMDDSVTQAEEKFRIKQMRYQLSSMVQGSLAPLRMTKYPTKSGKLIKMKSVNLLPNK